MTAAECTDALRPMAGLAPPATRRTVIVGASGLIVAIVLLWLAPLGMGVVAGWDAAALTFRIRRSWSRSSNSAGGSKQQTIRK
jgi:hypothetical protein